MKKLIVIGMLALGATCFGASEYQVYDFALNVKTTKAKAKAKTSCGDDYIYREAGSRKLLGIVAGCGCGAIKADGSCENALVLIWDSTSKTQITNAVLNKWIVQRIGKKGTVVEHMAEIETENFKITLGGLGSYSISKTDANLDKVSTISGHFAGYCSAPYLTILGSCSACGFDPGSVEQTTALTVCDCACSDAAEADTTPYYGTYVIKYNSAKSKKTSKNGISNASLGVPSYVKINLD